MKKYETKIYVPKYPRTYLVIEVPSEITSEFIEFVYNTTYYKIRYNKKFGWLIGPEDDAFFLSSDDCIMVDIYTNTLNVLDKCYLPEFYEEYNNGMD